MSFLTDGFISYLKERPTGKKLLDCFLIITVATWVAFAWVVANYFPDIKGVFTSHNVDIKSLVQLDKSINDILTITMTQIQADRGSLSRFHDTVSDVVGHHFVFESRSNEVVQPGVAPVAQIRQNMLLSMINTWALAFVKNDCVYVTNLEATDPFYEFFRQIGTKSSIKCAVFNTSNNLVGYVDMEWTTRNMTLDDMKKKEPQVREAAEKIGAILSVKPE
jgi:hypothetical protein